MIEAVYKPATCARARRSRLFRVRFGFSDLVSRHGVAVGGGGGRAPHRSAFGCVRHGSLADRFTEHLDSSCSGVRTRGHEGYTSQLRAGGSDMGRPSDVLCLDDYRCSRDEYGSG